MGKTPYFTKDNTDRKWVVVDAADQVLGRFASEVANLLIGKHSPRYTPGQDCGVFVVVKNALQIRVTGNKLKDKLYHHHSGYPGGLKTRTLEERLARHPEEVLRDAVKGMLPRNKLGNRLITKLKIYTGEDHPHKAQLPEDISLDNIYSM